MILPPSGSSRGEFDEYLNEFERAFLARDMRVVSAAVTGRVVQERKNESAAQLSDLERALILAKETGADAVLQIGGLDQRTSRSRYFCSPNGSQATECSSQAYTNGDYGRRIDANAYGFQGKVIDVKSGEVLASLNLSTAAVDHLEVDLVSDSDNQENKKIGSCLVCKDPQSWWCKQCRLAEERAVNALVEALVRRVSELSLAERGSGSSTLPSGASQL